MMNETKDYTHEKKKKKKIKKKKKKKGFGEGVVEGV
jgi:hypothetical protein